jgi:hypothetical protein
MGATVGDGILARFSSWNTVSSSLWIAAPHKPSDPLPRSRREAEPSLVRSHYTDDEDKR